MPPQVRRSRRKRQMSRHGEGSQGERAAARPAAARRAPHHSSKLIPHASGCTSRREARNSRQRGGQKSCCTSKHPPRRPRTAIVALKRPLPLPFPDQCKAQAASLRAAPRAKPPLAALKRTQGRSCHIVCPHFFPRRAPLHTTRTKPPSQHTPTPLHGVVRARPPDARVVRGARRQPSAFGPSNSPPLFRGAPAHASEAPAAPSTRSGHASHHISVHAESGLRGVTHSARPGGGRQQPRVPQGKLRSFRSFKEVSSRVRT